MRYWTQYTTTWVPTDTPSGGLLRPRVPPATDMQELQSLGLSQMPFASWVNNFTPPAQGCGSALSWDSTRIVGNSTPDSVMDQDQTNLGQLVQDSSSIVRYDAVTDNVLPRSMMVTVTMEPPSELSVANPLRLVQAVGVNDTNFTVTGNAPPLNAQWPYVKIDDEWVRISSMQGNTIQVDTSTTPNGRGARGTEAAAHDIGAHVQIGYTFSRIFNNPAAREYWGQ